MKALTVQQPWAWAIIHGGKDIENRTQAWRYRGPLAIHAGARLSERGLQSELLQDAWRAAGGPPIWRSESSAIIGVVDLVGVHRCSALNVTREVLCCDSAWAEQPYDERHGGIRRRNLVHLVLENPRPLAVPIPCRGALGLWTPPAEVLEQLPAAARAAVRAQAHQPEESS